MKAARALGALLTLALLLVGAPWVLLKIGSIDYLLQVDPAGLLTARAGSALILALLSCLGWLAWVVITLTTVFEFIAVLTRRRVRLRLPGTGWLRPMIGALVMAAVLTPSIADADPIRPPPATVPPPAQAQPTVTSPPATRPAEVGRVYVVQEGDELWDIAERELGSGERWREIVALSPDIVDSFTLTAGQVLTLPVTQMSPLENVSSHVVVQRGDSLWAISERVLGDGNRWPEIHALNRGQIADPDEIDVGWVLQLPDTAPSATASPEVAAEIPGEVHAEAAVGPAAEPPAGVPSQGPVEALTETPVPVEGPVEAPIETPGRIAVRAGLPASDPTQPPPAARRAGEATSVDSDPLTVLGPIGALLALGVVAGVATRRRAQLLGRAVGRRLVPVPEQVSRFWGALAVHADDAPDPEEAPPPTTVLLGWAEDGSEVPIELERERATVLTGSEATAGLAAIVTGLSSAPWSEGVELIVVGGAQWAEALDDPRVTASASTSDGLAELARTCSRRRLAMRGRSLPDLRSDPDLDAAWNPVVFLFEGPLSATQFDAVADALALGEVGVGVVATAPAAPHIEHAAVELETELGTFRGKKFTPQLVGEPARRVLLELFRATGSTETVPAPWWSDSSSLRPNVLPLPLVGAAHGEEQPMPEPPEEHPHPTLSLLGEVELLNPAGQEPNRARMQCIEYCAWLLAHPGATPTVMTRDLLVAESTRRSNMCRLRAWLGTAPDGSPYLPDAYTGRIRLDERVTSDWERFEALLAGGVNSASPSALRQALRLVRGEPLGASAFQWHWAQTLRADMVSMIVDAASVLADRAIEHDDPDLALWAVARGRLAAPEDDQLRVRAIHAFAVAARAAELDREVLALNRSVRAAGRDLPVELAHRVQLAIHLRDANPRPVEAVT